MGKGAESGYLDDDMGGRGEGAAVASESEPEGREPVGQQEAKPSRHHCQAVQENTPPHTPSVATLRLGSEVTHTTLPLRVKAHRTRVGLHLLLRPTIFHCG